MNQFVIVLKVFKIDSIESKSLNTFAEIEFEDEEILQINLNCDQTRLIVLLYKIQDEVEYKFQKLNVYDLTTLAQNTVINMQ